VGGPEERNPNPLGKRGKGVVGHWKLVKLGCRGRRGGKKQGAKGSGKKISKGNRNERALSGSCNIQ